MDFEIGGRKFKAGKMSAIKQFHIVRRIGPILNDVLPAIGEIQKFMKGKKESDLNEGDHLEQIAKFAGPIMEGLSKLSDVDAEKVLFGLLECVETQQEHGNWAKVVTGGNMLMFENLEFPILIQLAGRAFAVNLKGFFSALPQQ